MISATRATISGNRSNFSIYSFLKQSRIAALFLKYGKEVSNGDLIGLFKYCLFQSIESKKLQNPIIKEITSNKELTVIHNLRQLHQSCGSEKGTSSTVLSTVAGVYTASKLRDLGFEFSAKQYKLAKQKASNRYFCLKQKNHVFPESRARISEEIVTKVNEILEEFSNASTKTLITRGKNGENTIQPIRILRNTRIYIYNQFKLRFPEAKLSLSKFYALCPKHYQNPSKKTDICSICIAGNKAKLDLEQAKNSNSFDVFRTVRLQKLVDDFEAHQELEKMQKDAFKDQKQQLDKESCIVIADFKENFRIGGGPVESGNNFYQKVHISDLHFCIIYKENEEIKRSYHNFLSENLSHDSLFVINYFKTFLGLEEIKKFKKVHFWSDSGPHFKNGKDGIKLYQSYYMDGRVLNECVIGQLDASDCLAVSYSVKTVKDSRVDKYAPAFPIQRDCLGDKTGPASKKVQDGRIRMLRRSGIGFGSG
ncbi:hypothetical protein BB560_004430 [Smittium megazygosporum]|uniref:Uncharacterized protein n=1 Tax=Smittium megazygosporum TaxID=133381 RepID=A0A2T9Z9C9_9FUNG|nr:hypothetical protein BB560_004430 [Smittium megazygosporum]